MNEKQIKLINLECVERGHSDQGIFFQGSCIPTHIKEHTLYARYNTHGMCGGGWWDDAELTDYQNDKPNIPEVAIIAARRLRPHTTDEELQGIGILVRNVDDAGYDASDYYGNIDYYEIDYILLSDFMRFINQLFENDARTEAERSYREFPAG